MATGCTPTLIGLPGLFVAVWIGVTYAVNESEAEERPARDAAVTTELEAVQATGRNAAAAPSTTTRLIMATIILVASGATPAGLDGEVAIPGIRAPLLSGGGSCKRRRA
jgi:hypothetical protein